MAARIISGKATRATYQKLLAKERATPDAAAEYQKALALVTNDSERRYLEKRLKEVKKVGK